MQEQDDPRSGFRWPIAVSRPIGASAEEVWNAISAPGNLERCQAGLLSERGLRLCRGPYSEHGIAYDVTERRGVRICPAGQMLRLLRSNKLISTTYLITNT